MHDYSEMKRKLGHPVNQTLDSPIMILEIWELQEIFIALISIGLFGIVLYEWGLLCIVLSSILIGLPYVRRNFNKGMIFHYPYRHFGMGLRGLVNPKGRRRFSD